MKKFSVPHYYQPNIAVYLDVLSLVIHNCSRDILVMLDHGDICFRYALLPDRLAVSAFQTYFTSWIFNFVTLFLKAADRVSDLFSSTMCDSLLQLQSQLCNISEALWSLGANERSHKFLKKSIDRLLSQLSYISGHDISELLSEVRLAWSLTLHGNDLLLHYHGFRIMSRVLSHIKNDSRLSDRQQYMTPVWEVTALCRTKKLIRWVNLLNKRQLTKLRHFNINQYVWFHNHLHGWIKGMFSKIDPPTIYVYYKGKLYATHEALVRPKFGKISVPPFVLSDHHFVISLYHIMILKNPQNLHTLRHTIFTPPHIYMNVHQYQKSLTVSSPTSVTQPFYAYFHLCPYNFSSTSCTWNRAMLLA